MSHTIREREKLLKRVRRLKGQIEAVERALQADSECSEVLRIIASCRGAMAGLMAEVVEGHIRNHLHVVPGSNSNEVGRDELIDIVRAYLK